ncbi:MAG: hypothetical protein IPJ82_13170 [Lewinellaceae bacterium]|nr:hypothetical protein [Lewinellaceae bacterium]
MLTWRQKMGAGNYQVGDLISTIPLAPKEIRKYSTKQVIKKSRNQKEIEDSQSSRSSESSATSRAESEITKQARDKTSFEQTANGQVSVGVFQGEFGTRFGVEAEKTSSNAKKISGKPCKKPQKNINNNGDWRSKHRFWKNRKQSDRAKL